MAKRRVFGHAFFCITVKKSKSFPLLVIRFKFFYYLCTRLTFVG